MATFFYNGATFRTDIIDGIISKVSELRDAVREVGGGRADDG